MAAGGVGGAVRRGANRRFRRGPGVGDFAGADVVARGGVVPGAGVPAAAGPAVGTPAEIFSSVLTRPAGGVSLSRGGPGAKRFPSIGAGGCTPGATPVPGFARRGPSAGRSGAGECWASAKAAQPARQAAASVGDVLKVHPSFPREADRISDRRGSPEGKAAGSGRLAESARPGGLREEERELVGQVVDLLREGPIVASGFKAGKRSEGAITGSKSRSRSRTPPSCRHRDTSTSRAGLPRPSFPTASRSARPGERGPGRESCSR